MEIDITRFFTGEIDTWPLSGSVATHGPDAHHKIWENALSKAKETPFLVTPAQVQTCRDHIQAMGFGEDIQAYEADAVNALFLQLVAGDMRESGLDYATPDDDEIWLTYDEETSEGRHSGSIGRGWSDPSHILYEAALAAGWFTYCGDWYSREGAFASSAYEACASSDCLPPCDAVFYSLEG